MNECPLRENSSIGQFSVQALPLVPLSKILLPPLHLKLGLASQFLKVLGKKHSTTAAFQHLTTVFAGQITEAKLKAGVVTGPQIRTLRKDSEFANLLQSIPDASDCWNSFCSVVDNILGSASSTRKKDFVENFLNAYQRFNCNMSLKVHMFHRHQDKFYDTNMGDMTEESGERFHRDIFPFEERYKSSKDHCRMLGDYCNSLIRETDPSSYNRKSRSKLYFKV